MQWTLHQIKLLYEPDKNPSTSVNTKCFWRPFPVGVCYSSIITCLQFVLGPKCGQRRKIRKSHTEKHISQQRDYGCSYSSSHCGSKAGGVFWWAGALVAGRRMDQTRRGTGAMWQRMCRGRRWGPLENLGDGASGQGPPTPTWTENAAAERDAAPVLSRYRQSSESTEGNQYMAANPGEGES